MATTRPNQSVDAFESNGSYFVSFSNPSHSATFYLNQRDAIDLLLTLTDALQGRERPDYLVRLEAISLYQKSLLTNA